MMVTRKSIERGETIAAPLRKPSVFPPMVTQMIGVGEATGALDTMLSKIADFYEEEVDTAVAGLLTLLEPVMIACPRRHRRRHRHRDVSADLRLDQQAGVTDDECRTCAATNGSRRLDAGHRGSRVISTLLLGRRPSSQITSPGSLPVDPFFFLIGLTYALTIVYALTLRLRRAAPLAGGSAARRRRAASSSAFIYFTGGDHELFRLAVRAAR